MAGGQVAKKADGQKLGRQSRKQGNRIRREKERKKGKTYPRKIGRKEKAPMRKSHVRQKKRKR
jgi:hypothetical protein